MKKNSYSAFLYRDFLKQRKELYLLKKITFLFCLTFASFAVFANPQSKYGEAYLYVKEMVMGKFSSAKTLVAKEGLYRKVYMYTALCLSKMEAPDWGTIKGLNSILLRDSFVYAFRNERVWLGWLRAEIKFLSKNKVVLLDLRKEIPLAFKPTPLGRMFLLKEVEGEKEHIVLIGPYHTPIVIW